MRKWQNGNGEKMRKNRSGLSPGKPENSWVGADHDWHDRVCVLQAPSHQTSELIFGWALATTFGNPHCLGVRLGGHGHSLTTFFVLRQEFKLACSSFMSHSFLRINLYSFVSSFRLPVSP